MKPVFHSTYDLDRYPLAATITRSVVAIAIAASFAAAWITAGPGNGIVPVQDWSFQYRTDVPRLALPTLTVVGHRDGTSSVASVSCARGA